MKRGFLACALAACMTLAATGCENSIVGKALQKVSEDSTAPSAGTDGQIVMTEEEFQAALDAAAAGAPAQVELTEAATEMPTPAPVEEQLILDAGGLQVFYRGYDPAGYYGGATVNVRVVNNTQTDYTIQVKDENIDGVMVDAVCSINVPAGKTAIDRISLSASNLAKNQIANIGSFEFKVHIFDTNDWSNSIDSDPIVLTINQPAPVE